MSTTSPNRIARTVVWIISVIVVIITLALMFFADLPLWGGLIITAVILLPCQVYLNRTKPKK